MKADDAAFSVDLTDEQQRMVNQMYSTILFNGTGSAKYKMPGTLYKFYDVDGLRSVMRSKEWQKMDDEARTKKVTDMKATVKELVTAYVVENYR